MWSVRFSARRVAIPGGGTTSRPDVHAPPALVSAPRGCGSLSQGAKQRASQTELGFECESPSGEVRLVLSSITLKVQKFNTMDVCVSSCNSPAWPAGQEGRGLKVAADGHSRTIRACFLRPCWALASGRGGRGGGRRRRDFGDNGPACNQFSLEGLCFRGGKCTSLSKAPEASRDGGPRGVCGRSKRDVGETAREGGGHSFAGQRIYSRFLYS